MQNHQADSPLYVWPDVWSVDFHLLIKSMVIHDTKCPYWDQVSLNNTNQTKPCLPHFQTSCLPPCLASLACLSAPVHWVLWGGVHVNLLFADGDWWSSLSALHFMQMQSTSSVLCLVYILQDHRKVNNNRRFLRHFKRRSFLGGAKICTHLHGT